MKISTTLALAVLLSGLSLYYFVWEKPSHRAPSELGPSRILPLAEGDWVTRFELFNRKSGERISLVRSDSGWKIESPVSYAAEDFLAEGVVRALTFSQRIHRYPLESQQEEGDFGFRAPEIEVTVEAKKSPKQRTLVVGKESPVGTGVFVRWQDEREYFLISKEIKASLERSLYSLRQKKLFRLRSEEVTWMVAKEGERQFRVEKKGSHWHWVIPSVKREIPVEKVSELLYAFQSLYVKEFLDRAKTTERDLGLQSSNFFLAMGGPAKSEKLILGARVKGKEAVYAYRVNENLVLRVSEENLRSLFQAFTVTFQEIQDVDSKKSGGGSGKNPKGVPAGGKKSR